ncbi:hypothetical protein LG291_26665 (plasmid) [Cytobacillus firmus]|uniref:hypothetical protein n=1 Tax=Cytobacillus firmus TaxID=1399 RepID=UPI0038500C69
MHRFCSKSTNISTITIHPDTVYHHFQIILAKACIITNIAGLYTFKTCLNALFIGLAIHRIILSNILIHLIDSPYFKKINCIKNA